MTSLITLPAPRSEQRPRSSGEVTVVRPHAAHPVLAHPAWWLVLICAAQVLLTRVTRGVPTAFEDEGLYIFMGHRMLDHLLHGTFLQEFPGSYFSGAPGVYPVLAALADSAGGLPAVRAMSLVFVLLTTVGVYGLGAQLFGRLPGLFGAATFAVCGSVIYQSQWATFDAMTMMLLVLGAWLAVYSSRRDGLLWAPAVAAVLGLAVLTKYAGLAYVPFIVGVAVAEAWPRFRWLAIRRGLFTVAATAAWVYFVLMLWGRDLLPGIAQTTTSRVIIQPAPRAEMLRLIAEWAGPWLALCALGGLLLIARQRSRTPTALLLLAASVIGPAQQVRIGEMTSLGKHLAFGVALGAPLAGYLLASVLRGALARRRWFSRAPAAVLALAVVGAVLAGLTGSGIRTGSYLRTLYPDDSRLVSVLRTAVANNPGLPILGEKPSPQRYEMRDVTTARQWSDTYQFTYAGLSGPPAYVRAIRDHYFGVIYLSYSTANAQAIAAELERAPVDRRYYHLVAMVPRSLRGHHAGDWLVWAPQTTHLTPID